jgi:nucleotide-binding universal stress UspA family protein
MPSLSRILLPVDFSDRSAGAARCARVLAQHFSSEVVLLHALAPLEYQLGGAEMAGVLLGDVYRHQAEEAARELEQFQQRELAPFHVRCLVREGEPASRIIEFAHTERVDLIVMPTHGYGPFRRFILGSSTAKVLHDAECPVWTGVHMAEAPVATCSPLRHIVCALDLGPQSEHTLAWADWLSREFDARLTLMHTTAAIPDTGDRTEEVWRANLRWSAEKELERLKAAVGSRAELFLDAGDPAKSICASANRLGADLLVIGRGSAAGGFGRLRTNAYAIIRQSPCPVVSV